MIGLGSNKNFALPPGYNGGPAWLDRRHNGSPHRLLHSQWGRDHLLPPEVSVIFSFQNLIHTLSGIYTPIVGLLLRFFMSLRVPEADVISATKKRFKNHLMTKT